MTMDEIERVLGADVVDRVQQALQQAYVVAHGKGTPDAVAALEDLVLLLLAAVIEPAKDDGKARHCLVLLRAALDAVKADLARPVQ